MDINDATPGKTPLKMAKDKGHTAIVWFLESHGARVWIPILRNLTRNLDQTTNKQTYWKLCIKFPISILNKDEIIIILKFGKVVKRN